MKLKKFDELNEKFYELRNFNGQKDDVLDKIDELMLEYDKFTLNVAPEHWRITGTHFSQLRSMRKEVEEFTEIKQIQRIMADKLEKGKKRED